MGQKYELLGFVLQVLLSLHKSGVLVVTDLFTMCLVLTHLVRVTACQKWPFRGSYPIWLRREYLSES